MIESQDQEGDIIIYSTFHSYSFPISDSYFPLDYYYRGSAPIYLNKRQEKDRSNIQAHLKIRLKVYLLHTHIYGFSIQEEIWTFLSLYFQSNLQLSQEVIGNTNILSR